MKVWVKRRPREGLLLRNVRGTKKFNGAKGYNFFATCSYNGAGVVKFNERRLTSIKYM